VTFSLQKNNKSNNSPYKTLPNGNQKSAQCPNNTSKDYTNIAQKAQQYHYQANKNNTFKLN